MTGLCGALSHTLGDEPESIRYQMTALYHIYTRPLTCAAFKRGIESAYNLSPSTPGTELSVVVERHALTELREDLATNGAAIFGAAMAEAMHRSAMEAEPVVCGVRILLLDGIVGEESRPDDSERAARVLRGLLYEADSYGDREKAARLLEAWLSLRERVAALSQPAPAPAPATAVGTIDPVFADRISRGANKTSGLAPVAQAVVVRVAGDVDPTLRDRIEDAAGCVPVWLTGGAGFADLPADALAALDRSGALLDAESPRLTHEIRDVVQRTAQADTLSCDPQPIEVKRARLAWAEANGREVTVAWISMERGWVAERGRPALGRLHDFVDLAGGSGFHLDRLVRVDVHEPEVSDG